MKKRIFSLILALALTMTGTLVASAADVVTGTDLRTEAHEHESIVHEDYGIEPMALISSCTTCGRSLNYGAVTVGASTNQSHSYGLFWVHSCSYKTAPISRPASCTNTSCSFRTTANGTRYTNHGAVCKHSSSCTATCSDSNEDKW